jgi:menaquinone-9 beta-reductase
MVFVVKSETQNPKSKIVIVGAGPAGASLAIRLAKENFEVVLIERENFPRQKLCGEFVSPECLAHFEELSVLNEMLAVGGDRITQTCFYEPEGKSVIVPSEWFGSAKGALSISRAEMDFRLLKKAKESGVEVLEETQVVGVLFEKSRVCGVKAKSKTRETQEISADLTIDATGRANVLGSLAVKKLKVQGSRLKVAEIQNPKSKIQNRLVGFKAHVRNANIEKGKCEIYFFRGGYGGLSRVENNLANHCFLIGADAVKAFSGDANRIVEEVIFQNKRAFETLKTSMTVHDWLSVSVDGFGVKNLNPLPNLFAIGDAAAFIDPFTGSGMLMALESAEIFARVVAQNYHSPEKIAGFYQFLHRRRFQKRLWVCALMRRAAFVPSLTKTLISVLSRSEKMRKILAHSTRKAFLIKGR